MFLLVTSWWEADHRRVWVEECATITELTQAVALLSKEDDWEAYEVSQKVPKKSITLSNAIAT